VQKEKLERFGNVTKAKGLESIILQGKNEKRSCFVDNLAKTISRSWTGKSLAELL